MNPIDTNEIWNLELFKKETANFIIVGHPDYPTLTGQKGSSTTVEKGN
ncbi:MAG: hypothetical protein WDM90_23080 [Ferruginibacter sp.]